MIRPIVKYHGGKGRIFRWIVGHLPSHEVYIEPFGGAASVLLNKEPVDEEIYNDLEYSIYNLFRVVQQDYLTFSERVSNLEYCKDVYLHHRAIYRGDEFANLSSLDQAITTYVVRRMSRGGVGGTFSWSKRVYSGIPAEVSGWLSGLKNLELIHQRIQNVSLTNQNGFDLLNQNNQSNVLVYCDPPVFAHNSHKQRRLHIGDVI